MNGAFLSNFIREDTPRVKETKLRNRKISRRQDRMHEYKFAPTRLQAETARFTSHSVRTERKLGLAIHSHDQRRTATALLSATSNPKVTRLFMQNYGHTKLVLTAHHYYRSDVSEMIKAHEKVLSEITRHRRPFPELKSLSRPNDDTAYRHREDPSAPQRAQRKADAV